MWLAHIVASHIFVDVKIGANLGLATIIDIIFHKKLQFFFCFSYNLYFLITKIKETDLFVIV